MSCLPVSPVDSAPRRYGPVRPGSPAKSMSLFSRGSLTTNAAYFQHSMYPRHRRSGWGKPKHSGGSLGASSQHLHGLTFFFDPIIPGANALTLSFYFSFFLCFRRSPPTGGEGLYQLLELIRTTWAGWKWQAGASKQRSPPSESMTDGSAVVSILTHLRFRDVP